MKKVAVLALALLVGCASSPTAADDGDDHICVAKSGDWWFSDICPKGTTTHHPDTVVLCEDKAGELNWYWTWHTNPWFGCPDDQRFAGWYKSEEWPDK